MFSSRSPAFRRHYIYIVGQTDISVGSVLCLECFVQPFSPPVTHELSVFVRLYAEKAERAWMLFFSPAPCCYAASMSQRTPESSAI